MIYMSWIFPVIAKLPSITNIYWGDTDDRQQAITPTNVDQGFGRLIKALEKSSNKCLIMAI